MLSRRSFCFFSSLLAGRGPGVERSYEKAVEYFQLAASGSESACPNRDFVLDNLGGLAFNLGGHGMAASIEVAINYFIRAAEAGNQLAMVHLGELDFFGHGDDEIAISYERAGFWYESQKAAARGDATSQTQLGWMCDHGDHVIEGRPQSDERAAYWYRLALKQNHAGRRHILNGECYSKYSTAINE